MTFLNLELDRVSGEMDVVIDNEHYKMAADAVCFVGKGDTHNTQFDEQVFLSKCRAVRGHLFELASGGALTISSGKQQLFAKILGLNSKKLDQLLEGFCPCVSYCSFPKQILDESANCLCYNSYAHLHLCRHCFLLL